MIGGVGGVMAWGGGGRGVKGSGAEIISFAEQMTSRAAVIRGNKVIFFCLVPTSH